MHVSISWSAKRSGCKVTTVTNKDADAECSFSDEPSIRFLANTIRLESVYTHIKMNLLLLGYEHFRAQVY